jgi:hypothetical protein
MTEKYRRYKQNTVFIVVYAVEIVIFNHNGMEGANAIALATAYTSVRIQQSPAFFHAQRLCRANFDAV